MTRADAQRLLDAIEPGHRLAVQVMRTKHGSDLAAVARWRGEHAFRATEVEALRDLVRGAYRRACLPVPEAATAPQPALPGVR